MRKVLLSICYFVICISVGQTPWSQLASIPSPGRASGCIFIIGDTVYAGAGKDSVSFMQDFYKYYPGTNTWTSISNIPSPRWMSTSFSIGNKGYVALGQGNSGALNEILEYDPQTNSWIQKSTFPGGARWAAFSFVINNKVYIGGGRSSSIDYNDLWEYDPLTNIWTQKSSFTNPRHSAIAFAINNKGYMGLGRGTAFYDDFSEYDPSTNNWASKSNFPDTARYVGTGFSVNNKGYAGLGIVTGITGSVYRKDFWEYDPNTNIWTSVADIPGLPRFHSIAASNNTTAYILGGLNWDINPGAQFLNDFYSFPYKNFAGIMEGHSDDCSLYYYNKKIFIKNRSHVAINITLTDIMGKKIYSGVIEHGEDTIDLSTLSDCLVVYQVETKKTNLLRGKIVIIN